MKDHELKKLIEAIQSYLDGGVVAIPSEVVALEYARECQQINDRLAKIGEMIQSGGELEALQIAEELART